MASFNLIFSVASILAGLVLGAAALRVYHQLHSLKTSRHAPRGIILGLLVLGGGGICHALTRVGWLLYAGGRRAITLDLLQVVTHARDAMGLLASASFVWGVYASWCRWEIKQGER